MKKILSLLSIICIGWCLNSCEKSSSYSDVPEIEFKKLIVDSNSTDGFGDKVKSVDLTFKFVDGDGDIGVRSVADTVSKIHYTWYKKLPDGQYEPHAYNTGYTEATQLIPYDKIMNKDEAQNKVLKGVIKLTINDPPRNVTGIDTMRIEYFIVDRARNKSNVDHTPDFSILDDYFEIEK